MAERHANEWRLRPAILAMVGVAAAVACQQLLDTGSAGAGYVQPSPQRVALAAAVVTGGLAFAFTAERVRLWWSVAFAGACAVIAGLVAWWNGGPNIDGLFDWQSASLLLAIVIAAPLFQTARDAGRARFPYAEAHGHAWTDVVLWFAGWGFTAIVLTMGWLLASLFQLIGIEALADLLKKEWVIAALVGGALGGGIGLFREREVVVRTLQRVVTAVLGVLAPVLGVGLLLFLVALPFTGVDALWEATKATTPILLACVIGALLLANAVIGDGEEEVAGNPALRWGATALAATILPLAVLAAVATGLRIGQYGFSPDRLWALTFVILACAWGLAYLVTLVRGRMAWADLARVANLRLAFAVCGIALFLALPIVSFNAISTRDQVARLESGRVTPERFDWAALAFDFGEPGKVALERLAGSANAAIAKLAKETAAKETRYEVADFASQAEARDLLAARVRILPVATSLPPGLRELLPDYAVCGVEPTAACTLLYTSGAAEAVAIQHGCLADIKPGSPNAQRVKSAAMTTNADCLVAVLKRDGGTWRIATRDNRAERDAPTIAVIKSGLTTGTIAIRPVTRRQLFVGGQPVGDPFE